MSKGHVRLNQGLDPEKFMVCVSSDCHLILDDYKEACEERCSKGPTECKKCKLEKYLESLGAFAKPSKAEPTARPSSSVQKRITYLLRGRLAIEHARRVHAKLQRHLLRYENVTAVDVGFAICEREERFLNALAIRIHVGTKHPVDSLRRHRLVDLVSPKWALPGRLAQLERSDKESPTVKYLRAAVRRVADLGPWGHWGVTTDDLTSLSLPDGESPAPPLPPDAATPASQAQGKGKKQAASRRTAEAQVDTSQCSCCWYCGRCCYSLCPRCDRCCHCCRGHAGQAARQWCPCCTPGGHKCGRCRLAICGVPLDVIEANYFPSIGHPGGDFKEGVFVDRMKASDRLPNQEALLTSRGRVSPLVGGISVGSVHGPAGTLGTVVWDETDGSPCALGAWHVLAGTAAEEGQPCYQPAIFDGGSRDDVIGHLKRWHLSEYGDVAIAELDGSRFFASGEILGLWHPISGCQSPELNLEIRKWGRTTGFTQGFIDGIHLATNIDYGNGFVRHFAEQFHIAPLYRGQEVSQVGDSGSLVLTSCDLDELGELKGIARAMLRKAPPDLLAGIRKLVGNTKDIEALISAIRALLQQYPEPNPPNCPSEELGSHPAVAGSEFFTPALQACRGQADIDRGAEQDLADFKSLLRCVLEEHGIDVDKYLAKKTDRRYRRKRRVYHVVGMIFAGDTPGSAFGEFAIASDIQRLAEGLRFSLRPVFEPRSSFRKLRSQPPGRGDYRRGRFGPAREPGEQGADPRGQGPQPDGEVYQSGSGNTGGGSG